MKERIDTAFSFVGKVLAAYEETLHHTPSRFDRFVDELVNEGEKAAAKVFSEMEHAARDEVLKSGGSLSHHHGIGKIRRDFLPQIMSPGMMDWQRQIKTAVDPANVFGAGNQALDGE